MTVPRYEPSENQQQQQSSSTSSRGSGRTRERDGYPFLNWKDIGVGNQLSGEVHLAWIDVDNFDKSKQCVVCKVSMGSKFYQYPLRVNNPNLQTLTEAWGQDETNWGGHKVVWSVDENVRTGRHNIVCTPVPAAKKGR